MTGRTNTGGFSTAQCTGSVVELNAKNSKRGETRTCKLSHVAPVFIVFSTAPANQRHDVYIDFIKDR